MQIRIFSIALGHEEELEQAVNKFMARSDIEVVDVVFDQKIVPGSGDNRDVYYGQSAVMVKYRTLTDKPLPPE